MNVGDECSVSCWMDDLPKVEAPPLRDHAECDVAIVGSGIAGLSVAYELSRVGRRVIVIDRGRIGSGMTARTTAHLTTENDDRYSDLVRVRGENAARLYHESQVAALDRIEAIVREEGIACDFARVDGYLFADEPAHDKQLEEEYDTCRKLGLDGVDWAERAPIPARATGRALRFANQGRFHPTRYLSGLAEAIARRGGVFHANTAYVSGEEKDGGVLLETESGARLRAGAAVFATNSPVNDKVAIHTKQVPYRTYVVAGGVARGTVEDALVWDTWQNRGPDHFYHYVRLQPGGEGEDLLIVGGEDHRSGEAHDMEARFAHLEGWARRHYPTLGEIAYRWSGQVLETVDFMPFTGRNPGNDNIYIHTGDSGIGISHGVTGALVIAPLILGGESRFAQLFDPGRKASASLPSLKEFASGVAGAVRNLTEYVAPGDVDSAEALKPGEGALVREGLHKIAAYRTRDGALVRRSAACTHMGCVVQWNPFEKCWDCPCHGSQFSAEGEVLNGPAVKALAEVEELAAELRLRAVRLGDRLEQMPFGIGEIDPPSAEMRIDLSRPGPRRIRPVIETARADPPEDRVEFRVAHQEGIMLDRDVALLLVEIERHMVVQVDDHEMQEGARRGPAEHLGEKGRGAHLVMAPDDRVVELDGHVCLLRALPRMPATRTGASAPGWTARARPRTRRRP